MRVSVVIPAYNEEKYIKKCLKSLEAQEVKPDEIIVVDNNCTDRTITIAKKFKVRIVKEKNQGMIFARNRGFNTAKYEIIARCDADTILPPDWIRRIKNNFKRNKIIALTGPAYFYDVSIPPKKRKVDLVYPTFLRPTKLIQKHETLFGANMAIRKSVWEKVKDEVCLDDSQVHEDMDLAFHINPLGKIRYSRSLKVGISARRFKKDPKSWVEYPVRWVKTMKSHNVLKI